MNLEQEKKLQQDSKYFTLLGYMYRTFKNVKFVLLRFVAMPTPLLTPFDMGFFEPLVMGEGIRAPNHNFVVIVPMIMRFGTVVKLDVFYTMATKNL